MNTILDEELNAFVDQQLTDEDRKRVLDATIRDPQLAEEVYSLYHIKELVQQAYREPPAVNGHHNPLRRRTTRLRWVVMSAVVIVTLAVSYQWKMGDGYPQNTFYDMNAMHSGQFAGKRVILHVDSNDPQRIQQAMQTVESLMRRQPPAKIEVVANGAGLILVRQGSAQAKEVHSLATRYANVEFKACGFAMEAARLKEGRPVILLPEAEKVDAALNEILRRLKEGWVYIKA